MKTVLLTSLMLLVASAAGFHTHADLLQRRDPPYPGSPDPKEPYRAAIAAGCKLPPGGKLASRDLDGFEHLLYLSRRAALAASAAPSTDNYPWPVPKGVPPMGVQDLINAVKNGNAPPWFMDSMKDVGLDCSGYSKGASGGSAGKGKQTGGGAGGGAGGGSEGKKSSAPSVGRRWFWEDEFEDLWVRDDFEMEL